MSPQVPPPATKKPTEAEFFAPDAAGERKPNHTFLKEHFFKEGRLEEEQALYIIQRATRLLVPESFVDCCIAGGTVPKALVCSECAIALTSHFCTYILSRRAGLFAFGLGC